MSESKEGIENKPRWTAPQFDTFFLKTADQYVYRYRSAKRAIQELKTGKLRMSSFNELNDPKEYAVWDFDVGARIEIDEGIAREIKEQGSIYAKACAKVLCATLDDEAALEMGVNHIWSRGFCRPRMWQPYGDNYRGVCMVYYDRQALDDAINISKPAGSLIGIDKVYYCDIPRVFKLGYQYHPFLMDCDRVREVGLKQAIQEHIVRHGKLLFFQKASDWQSEKEYRWLICDNTHKEHFFEVGGALKGVILGSNIHPKHMEKIERLCAPHRIIPKQLTWRNGAPDIGIRVPIDIGENGRRIRKRRIDERT